MQLSRLIVVLAAAVLVAACGSNRTDRVTGGAALGAASGAAVGAAFGGVGIGAGALIGAAVGGVGGAVTDQRDINLGQPIWR